MKTLKTLLVAFAALIFCVNVNAQCTGESWNFDEDDFMAGSISATEAAPSAGPITTNQVDLNGDGTNDIQLTYEAIVTSPNANGTCDDGDFNIQASWGGASLPLPGPSATSDFGGSTSDDCPCTNGLIVMTVDMVNGFNSDVANFEFDATSQNGSSEGYEYGFGFVTAATDAAGNPITGLNTAAAATAALANYCNAQYVGGMTASSVALSSPTGVFTTQADDFNATANTCTTEGQNGEDTDSGSGPNSGLTTGVSGLAPTDVITQVTYIYGLSNAPGTDCDGDGDTGVGTNPSGSFAGIAGCYAPPCGYTLTAADVIITESCGTYSIEFTNLGAEGAADPVTSAAYNILIDGAAIASSVTGDALATTDITANVTSGTPFTLTIQNAADTTCSTDLMLAPPVSNPPVAPVFVPCTTGTTGVGGN